MAQATTPQPTPERKPLDLNTLRPVVASAAGASSTTTPSSVRWQKGQEPLPLNAQAYAALPAQIPPSQKAALQAKIEAIHQLLTSGDTSLTTGPGNPTAPNPTYAADLATMGTELEALRSAYLEEAATNILSQVAFTERGTL